MDLLVKNLRHYSGLRTMPDKIRFSPVIGVQITASG